MSKKRAVVVLGIGSDGTSLFAGVLHRLGFYLGEGADLIAPNKQNPKGFYEHRGLSDINRVIITKEHNVGEYMPTEIIENSIYKNDLAAFFEGTFGKRNRIALKDPRFCVTLPVWSQVIEKTHELMLLVVHRDIESHLKILVSGGKKTELEVRDYINNRHALQRQLAQRYRSLYISFDSFIKDPEANTRELVKQLKTRISKKQMEDIVRFIKE